MCQCKFINCNKCTTLVVYVDNGGGYTYVEAGGKWEISVPSTLFCCVPKNALTNVVLINKNCDKSKCWPGYGKIAPLIY